MALNVRGVEAGREGERCVVERLPVVCDACGAEYETTVSREVVEALRRCGECGMRALHVADTPPRHDELPPAAPEAAP